jgi:hypothetical protein
VAELEELLQKCSDKKIIWKVIRMEFKTHIKVLKFIGWIWLFSAVFLSFGASMLLIGKVNFLFFLIGLITLVVSLCCVIVAYSFFTTAIIKKTQDSIERLTELIIIDFVDLRRKIDKLGEKKHKRVM